MVQAVKPVETRTYKVDGSTSIDNGTMPGGASGSDWICERTTVSYNQYGNVMEKTQGDFTPGDWGYDKASEYTEYIHETESGRWLFLPKRSYSYKYNNNNDWTQASEKRLYYDDCAYGVTNGIGLLTRGDEYYDILHFVTTGMSYDAYGNVHTRTDGEGNVYTFTYDDVFNDLLISQANPPVNGVQIISHTEYNDLGLPFRETDANGAVTETRYDLFGRANKIISPGDTLSYSTVDTVYHDADGTTTGDGTPFAWKEEKKREISGQPGTYDVCAYLDGFGNVIQTKSEARNENGVYCWETANNWSVIEGDKKVTYSQLPYYSATSVFDRPVTPNGQFYKAEEYFNSAFGKVNMKTDASGLSTYEYYKHNKKTAVDPAGYVSETEAFPRANESKSYSYTGKYPNQTLYSTITTKETFNQKKIIDDDNHELVIVRDWMGRQTETHDPDMGTWSYQYNNNGNLAVQTDAKNQAITLAYDALGRIVRKTYPDSTFVLYYYDGVDETGNPDPDNHGACLGRGTHVFYAGGIGSESYKFDLRGRVEEISKTIDSKTRTMRFEYDAMNRIVKEILPDNEELVPTYSDSGDTVALTGNQNYAFDLKYAPARRLTSISYGNGVTTNYDFYDESNEIDPYSGIPYSQRLKQIRTNKQGLLNFSFAYDLSGNLKQKSDLEFTEFSETYLYDDLGRLTGADAEIYGNKSYSYDRINNILTKDGRSYLYSPAKPHAVTNDGVYDYVYDDNGNMIEKRQGGVLVRGITYDYQNRVIGLSDGGSFSYDNAENRIIKQEGNKKTIYFFSQYEEVYESEVKTDTLKYYSINGIRIAQFSSITGLHYIHSDHLGSSVRLSDGTGALVNITAYAPFGEELEITLEPVPDNLDLTAPLVDTIEHYKARNTIRISASVEGVSDIFSEAGETIKLLPGFKVQRGAKFKANINEVLKTVINLGSIKPRYKFTGKELDSSGLYYYGARYYDPALGRFISADTYLDGLNRYAYCGNNPVRFVDPTGHFWLELGLILLGAYIGGAAANNWQWNPLQWNWGNYQTYLGMAIGGLVGAAAGYVIGSLASTPRTENNASNAGVQTNPYNTSTDADQFYMQVGVGYDLWRADNLDVSESLELTGGFPNQFIAIEHGYSFVEFSCINNPGKHFIAIVKFNLAESGGLAFDVGANLIRGTTFAILPNNYNFMEVTNNYTQGYATVLVASYNIKGPFSGSVMVVRSGDFWGYGLGGSIGAINPFSVMKGSFAYHLVRSVPISYMELPPVGALVPPLWKPKIYIWPSGNN